MEVNLRKLYPTLYSSDVFVEVSDEVFEAIRAFERAEAAWQRRKYRYRAQYSLDYGNGIENDLLLWPETPEEAFEAKMMRREIFEALFPGGKAPADRPSGGRASQPGLHKPAKRPAHPAQEAGPSGTPPACQFYPTITAPRMQCLSPAAGWYFLASGNQNHRLSRWFE